MLDRVTWICLFVCAGCEADVGPTGVDAGIEPDVGTAASVVVDFGIASAAFPPTVNKIGFNSCWNAAGNDGENDTWTIERSAAYRAPMISGLVEPKSLVDVLGYQDAYKEYAGKVRSAEVDVGRATLWDRAGGVTTTLFERDAGGVVVAHAPVDADLAGLRDLANSRGLVNFLQLAGTPGTVAPGARYPVTDTFDNGLFTLVGTPTTGGNWYPLPANADYPALAHAFGTLPQALGPATRTIYAFWQEPSHTISESITADTSIDRYTKFYAQVAHELAQCPQGACPVAGAQLNANDGDHVPADGYRYGMFMDALRAQRLANPGTAMPLDYFTIQNYAAQWNDNIMANARVALGTDASWTPVLMNEWDYCVNFRDGDGCGPELMRFEDRYEGPAAWHALHWLVDSIDRPDVSHVLLREKVLQDRDAMGAPMYPWSQIPILFLASMSELRRPTSAAVPELPVIASGDPDQIKIIAWNEGTTRKLLPLALVHVPATLVGEVLFVKRISKAIRDVRCPGADVMDATHAITCWEDAVPPVTLASSTELGAIPVEVGEVVMLFAGHPPTYASSVFANNFVRSSQHVHRDGGTAAPAEMAHFDPRTGTITVGVRPGGHGVGRMQLANTPSTLAVSTRVAALQGATAVAGIRVDYLDANRVAIASVLFRDDRWPASPVPWAELAWPTTGAPAEVLTSFCGTSSSTGCADGNGDLVTLDLAGHAPAGWAPTHDVDLGVIVAGADHDAIYRVDFP